MENARESLEDARILHERARYRGSTNRSYYAMFYAASALLATKGLGSSKHSGVLSLLHKEFVKSRLFSAEVAKLMDKCFDFRVRTDYKDLQMPTAEQSSEMLAAAEEFLKETARVLESLTG
jgi:uncharacterized protein (UPF0332 family)